MFLLQKRVIRIISHSEHLVNSNELFKNLNTLRMIYIVHYKCYILPFKAFHSLLPVSLNLHFQLKSSPYDMISTNDVIEYISQSNTVFSAINISIHLWNNLCDQIIDVILYTSCKSYIKSMYIKHIFEHIFVLYFSHGCIRIYIVYLWMLIYMLFTCECCCLVTRIHFCILTSHLLHFGVTHL